MKATMPFALGLLVAQAADPTGTLTLAQANTTDVLAALGRKLSKFFVFETAPRRVTMDDMSPHVSTVFKELFEELRFMKRQQWTITNYSVLILAAIYWVKLPELSHGQSKLKFLAILTAVAGSFLLLRIQSNMARSRCRLDKLHKTYFERDELEGIGLTVNERNNLEGETWWRRIAHWWRGWEFLLALMLVLWVGAYLVAHAL